MARFLGVYNASHTPFCFAEPETWNETRAARSLRQDVPFDDLEESRKKAGRLHAALEKLRLMIAEAEPDVVVVFAAISSSLSTFAISPGWPFTSVKSSKDVHRRQTPVKAPASRSGLG